ncbi:MAG: DUF4446 family protein [Lachnospiraceae bacterium]|jgi:ABC-type multidrug transport system fused ATPase/permease subunit|nr:DUF4446 family protein [Lachnospiraceae bacterium]MCI9602377.1 DUF4446 family protein [Lachnospiraceae bacterium]
MNSPILEYLMSYGIDPAYIMIGISAVLILLIILYLVCIVKMKKLRKAYNCFMKGKDMESMEEVLMKQFDRIKVLEEADREKRKEINSLKILMQKSYQKAGLVKYDAFREMSGKLSYALALLDQNDNGVIITSMYSRDGCFSYAKEVIMGESKINLSEEEQEALEKAVNGEKITE